MSDPTQPYDELITSLKHVATFDSIGSLLSWDEETYMPMGGSALRADQSGLIARLRHQQFTSPRIGGILSDLQSSPLVADPQSDAAVNIRETRRLYDRAVKLPASLVEEMTRTAILAHHAWVEARKKSEFSLFLPHLDKTLQLKRQQAQCIGFTGHMYNALLDEFEPGETVEQMRQVFVSLRGPLVELVGRIVATGRRAPVEVLQRAFPIDRQQRFVREASAAVGFDLSAGRIDISAHPFCSGLGPGDCRITTRYDENCFSGGFFSVLHETGHALYDQGLPRQHWGTPLGDSISLGIHESQSRMCENLVGRSRRSGNSSFRKSSRRLLSWPM